MNEEIAMQEELPMETHDVQSTDNGIPAESLSEITEATDTAATPKPAVSKKKNNHNCCRFYHYRNCTCIIDSVKIRKSSKRVRPNRGHDHRQW